MYRLSILLLITILSCNDRVQEIEFDLKEHPNSHVDNSSFAHLSKARIKHLNLNIHVDFDSLIIRGVAGYNIDRNGEDRIHFDIKDIVITKILINDSKDFKKVTETSYIINKGNENGDDLEVIINEYTSTVHIVYKTTAKSRALNWLRPEQSFGKRSPFLYTQGFAIETRSWIPIQDSPGIRITYQANVKTPRNLMAVMSASNPSGSNDRGSYDFTQKNPIPPYLIALAVGDISSTPVGGKTKVYSEPGQLISASNELDDMEDMMGIAEALYGPYLWKDYSVLVLPPSFPLGGMENPQLSFLSPTILSGDKSLISTLAHELAHSWSGNLVTNATWNDFWLNEGFTVYIESRIMEEIKGKAYVELVDELAYLGLLNTINELPENDTHLKLDLGDRNPEDAMTDIAYQKGYFFLTEIENNVGREKMDEFLKKYFQNFAFKSITTEDFIAYLQDNLLKVENNSVDIEAWVYSSGLPENFSIEKSEKYTAVKAILSDWNKGITIDEHKMNDWSTIEWLLFLRGLPLSLTDEQLDDLDEKFQLSKSKNSEIQVAWFKVAIANNYNKVDPYVESFLIKVGRNKYLQVLYAAYLNSPEGLAKAQVIYAKARPMYHHVTTQKLDVLLKYEDL